MNLSSLRGGVAIVGVGQAGLGEAHGKTEMEILVEAAKAAVKDAGLSMRDIDGIATASVGATMWVMPVAEYLGIQPKFVDSTMIGISAVTELARYLRTRSSPFTSGITRSCKMIVGRSASARSSASCGAAQ